MAKTILSLVGAATFLYQRVMQKGVVALVRYRQDSGRHKFQSHFDWDDPQYDALMDHAESIKNSKNTND